MGGVDTEALALVEPSVKYHSFYIWTLTGCHYLGLEQWYVGSLTGAVSSQRVTEERNGTLSTVGNRAKSAKVKVCLTASQTRQADAKAGLSDPVVACGSAIAQRIKGTLGITGLSPPRVHIDGEVWHLDVGPSHPGAVEGPKGLAVRQLKRHASWVQTDVSQVGPYLPWV